MKSRKPNPTNSKRGSAIAAVLVIGTSAALLAAALLSHSLTERKINLRHELRLEAKNAAESIAEYGFAQLRNKFSNQTNFLSSALLPGSPDELAMPTSALIGANIDLTHSEIVGGVIPDYPTTLTYIDPANPDNEFDPLRGQKVYAREIGLYAKATLADSRGGSGITAYVSQRLQVRDAPLFAHAIFYNLDLEISPGPKMEIFGPVHTNGDLYLQAMNGVDFYYPVSTSQDMLYGWGTDVGSAQGTGWESLQTGDVKFMNRDEQLVSMKTGSGFADSEMDDWRTFSSNRWNGYLLTQDHGVQDYQPVAFPNYEPDDPATSAYDPVNSGHALIEPPLNSGDSEYNEEIENQKMSNKAGLYFKWDAETSTVTAFDKNGNELDISNLEGAGSDNLWEVVEDAMYDHRRDQYITLVEFNVGKLKQLIETPDYDDDDDFIGDYNPSSSWNGVVYFETSSSASNSNTAKRLSYSGIRLWGGDTDATGQGIPSRGADPGMTFASNNAIYIRGHFNADGNVSSTYSANNSAIVPETGEVPVAVFGDSVTVLSGNWNDSVSSLKPTASTTEVATAIVSGLIPSNAGGNGASSGGVHNFPRFLENWDNQALYIRGSLVCLYESEADDSTWGYDYYRPPARNWGFSELFLNGTYPPGTPLLRTHRRINYTSLTADEYNSQVASLTGIESSSSISSTVSSSESTERTESTSSEESTSDDEIEEGEIVEEETTSEEESNVIVVDTSDEDDNSSSSSGRNNGRRNGRLWFYH